MPFTSHLSQSAPLRRPSVAALFGFAGFAIAGTVGLVHPVGEEHWGVAAYLLNGAFLVGAAGACAALPAVGRLLGLGRAGRAAVLAVDAGFALMALQTVLSMARGGDVLGGLFFLGVLVVLVAGVIVAVSGIRAGGHRGAAAALPVSWVLAIALGDHGGTALFGLLWLMYAVLLGRSDISAHSPRYRMGAPSAT